MNSIIRAVCTQLMGWTITFLFVLAETLIKNESLNTDGDDDSQRHRLQRGELSELLVCQNRPEGKKRTFAPGLEIQIPYSGSEGDLLQAIPRSGQIVAFNGDWFEEFYSYQVAGSASGGTISVCLNRFPRLDLTHMRGASNIIMMGHTPAPKSASAE